MFLPLLFGEVPSKEFVKNGSLVMMLYSIVFSQIEKYLKEQFVINYSNEKTRKVLSQINDKQGAGVSTLIVTQKDNKIVYFN